MGEKKSKEIKSVLENALRDLSSETQKNHILSPEPRRIPTYYIQSWDILSLDSPYIRKGSMSETSEKAGSRLIRDRAFDRGIAEWIYGKY